MKTKICTKCGIKKLVKEFYKDERHIDKLQSACKTCIKEQNKGWKKNNPKQNKLINDNYRKEHAEQHKANNLKWNQTNIERMREIRRKSAKKINSTIRGKLNNRMRAGIYAALRSNKAGHSWEHFVGYNVYALKQHLESKFTKGMSWKNMDKWHVDHQVPKSFFKYNKPEDQEFQYCWSLDNLQPMWAKDNLIKHAKLLKV